MGEKMTIKLIGKCNIVWEKNVDGLKWEYDKKKLQKSTLSIEEYYSKRTLKIQQRDYNFK